MVHDGPQSHGVCCCSGRRDSRRDSLCGARSPESRAAGCDRLGDRGGFDYVHHDHNHYACGFDDNDHYRAPSSRWGRSRRHFRSALGHDYRVDDVPRESDTQLLRDRSDAVPTSGSALEVSRNADVWLLRSRRGQLGVVWNRLDRTASGVGTTRRCHRGGVRRLRQGSPLRGCRYGRSHEGAVPDGRHHQGLGHGRPRWLSAPLHGQSRQQTQSDCLGPRARRRTLGPRRLRGSRHVERRLGRKPRDRR